MHELFVRTHHNKLVGAAAIAEFLGEPILRARYLLRIGALPHYREGKIFCASKQVLREHHLEAARGAAKGEAA